MATYYCSSVSGDNTDGLTWAKAKTTLTAALALATADGDIIYVDSAHAVTAGAAITYNAPTAGTSIKIISVNRNGSTTTGHSGQLAGAAESVGAANAAFTIAGTGAQKLWIYGMTLNSGASAGGTADFHIATIQTAHATVEVVSCIIGLKGTGASNEMFLGITPGGSSLINRVVFRNTEVQLIDNASALPIQIKSCVVEAHGLVISYTGANKPTTCFSFTASSHADVLICDSDLSGYNTTSGNLVNVAGFNGGTFSLVNCKLSSTPGLVTGTWPSNKASITLVNTDSGDTHNVFEHRTRLGTITENATNVRNNGAQFNGTGVSWEIVTTASCTEQEPFITPWIHRWLTATGALTFDLELIRDSATDYTDREVWGEFEVLESASFPNGTLTSTRNAAPFDGTGVDLTNSAEVWTETLTNDNEMYVRASRTAAEKSLIRARLNVGVASTTLYLDPVVSIQGQGANPPTRWSVGGAFNAEPAGVLVGNIRRNSTLSRR